MTSNNTSIWFQHFRKAIPFIIEGTNTAKIIKDC